MISKIKKRILACLFTATFMVGNVFSGGFSNPNVNAASTRFSLGKLKDPPKIDDPADTPEVIAALNESIAKLCKSLNDGKYYVFVNDKDHPLKAKYHSSVVPNCYGFSCKNRSAYEFYKIDETNPLIRGSGASEKQQAANRSRYINPVVQVMNSVIPGSGAMMQSMQSALSSSQSQSSQGSVDDKGPYADLIDGSGYFKPYDGSAHYNDFYNALQPKLVRLSDHFPDGLLPRGGIKDKDTWNAYEGRKTLKGLRVVSPYGVDESTGLVKGLATITVIEYPLVNLSLEAFGEYLKHLVAINPDYTPDELFDSPDVRRKLVQEFGGFYYDMSVMDRVMNSGNEIFNNVKEFVTNFKNVLPRYDDEYSYRSRAENDGMSLPCIDNASFERECRVHSIYPADEIALRFYYSDVASWGTRTARKVRAATGFAGIATPVVMSGAVFWKLFNWTISQMGMILNRGAVVATNEFLRERNKLLNDPVKLRDAIKRMMKQGVVGLTDTIDKLTTLVTGSLALRKCSNLLNKNHCQLIAFIGPPGTGKSLLAQRYAIALTGKPIPNWGYITSASIKPGVSPSEQFFNSNSELVQNLKKSNGNTVIFIDEIDKFDSNQLLENLRDAVDKGTMVATSENTEQRPGLASTTTSKVIRTESINVSGLIVIVGTNEKPECWGLEPDPDRPEYTVGRTVVERSGSIVQRFQRFKFNPYTVDEYKQMYDNALNAILPEAVKMFGLHIVFDENLSKELAKESELRLMGGRSVPILLSEMAGAITSYNVNTNPDSLSFMSRIMNKMLPNRNLATLRISFDSASHKFKISEEPTQSRDKSSKAKSESVKLKAETAKVKSIKQTA